MMCPLGFCSLPGLCTSYSPSECTPPSPCAFNHHPLLIPNLQAWDLKLPCALCLYPKPDSPPVLLFSVTYRLRGFYSSLSCPSPCPPPLCSSLLHPAMTAWVSYSHLNYSSDLLTGLLPLLSPCYPSLYCPPSGHSLIATRMMTADSVEQHIPCEVLCIHLIQSLQQPCEDRRAHQSDFTRWRGAQRASQGCGLLAGNTLSC